MLFGTHADEANVRRNNIKAIERRSVVSVVQVVRMEALEGKTAELLALLQQGRAFTLTVAGCEEFEIYQGKDDPHRLLMIEHWVSAETHQAHFEKNVKTSGVLDRVMSLMTGPPELAYYVRC